MKIDECEFEYCAGCGGMGWINIGDCEEGVTDTCPECDGTGHSDIYLEWAKLKCEDCGVIQTHHREYKGIPWRCVICQTRRYFDE
jgi:DnaJ-class molecular chaperone